VYFFSTDGSSSIKRIAAGVTAGQHVHNSDGTLSVIHGNHLIHQVAGDPLYIKK